MTGFCRGDGDTDGLQVTHFSYKNNIRVFTESGAEGICIVAGIAAHFSLVYHGHLVMMHVFDRILQRDDVRITVGIDLINKGCQCGGLTATGRTRYQNQTSFSCI